MNVLVLERDAPALRRVGLRDRVSAAVHSSRLDHDLASGFGADRSVAHSLRARRLLSDGSLAELAATLRHLVWMARPRPSGMVNLGGVDPCPKGCVDAHRPALLSIAQRLADGTPVGVAGVAGVRILVSDGAGPMYHPGRCRELPTRVAVIARDLDPAAHLW